MKNLFLLVFTLLSTLPCMADAIDSLQQVLGGKTQVQEKVYVHTDNSTYFVGDTLWYKAYVVRSDNLQPTNLSKLLYVELLTPDGYLVERQHVVVNANGATCGQFELKDSLYSGYYEIRAYTRWQLNYNVTEKDFTRDNRLQFYNKQMAKDFFRHWEGLYSRVIPIYQKPKETGNYVERYMSQRPKQHSFKDKQTLLVSFFPEGGQMVQGIPCNVAFEVKDNHGQMIPIEGTLSNGQKIKTTHEGRGEFTITPGTSTIKASFTWNEKNYSFSLPKAQQEGITMQYDNTKRSFKMQTKGVAPAAYAVLCRGVMQHFERLSQKEGTQTVDISNIQMKTGVNEIIVYDAQAQPMASRLFFVDNNDYGKSLTISLENEGEQVDRKTTLKPYAPVNITVSAEEVPNTFSIAVRDAQTDDNGYDNGNIMTDMLLSSELRGFIPNPGQYFPKDDAAKLQASNNLDLLLKVQGWRRYKRIEKFRYLPETGLTYEGTVHKVPETARMLELEDVNLGSVTTIEDMMQDEMAKVGPSADDVDEAEDAEEGADSFTEADVELPDAPDADPGMDALGTGKMKKSVYVEAELTKDGDTAGTVTLTDKSGHFRINLPPFYDQAVLFVKAYNVKDSLKKCMSSTEDKGRMDERQFPDYYVKREMFFPIYSDPYSWYQQNSPQLFFVDEEDDGTIPENSSLSGNHMLQTVIVKARRRGKRGIDKTKPAIVCDAYKVYNNLTDYGLSWGYVDFRRLPKTVGMLYFGNMGRMTDFNIRAMVNRASFYRNYTPSASEFDVNTANTAMFNVLRLDRMQDIRLYTDYELRTDSCDTFESYSADVTMDFIPIADDGKRYTYRDRRYILDGITYAEEFYTPDYSKAIPAEPKDYRRTLYWNPNAKLGEDGTFHATFYNNSRDTRVSVSAAGIDSQGQFYFK